MGTVRLTTPFSDAAVEVDESRVETLTALGWSKVAKPRRKSAKADESDSAE